MIAPLWIVAPAMFFTEMLPPVPPATVVEASSVPELVTVFFEVVEVDEVPVSAIVPPLPLACLAEILPLLLMLPPSEVR
jgi:hypothetical protein